MEYEDADVWGGCEICVVVEGANILAKTVQLLLVLLLAQVVVMVVLVVKQVVAGVGGERPIGLSGNSVEKIKTLTSSKQEQTEKDGQYSVFPFNQIPKRHEQEFPITTFQVLIQKQYKQQIKHETPC